MGRDKDSSINANQYSDNESFATDDEEVCDKCGEKFDPDDNVNQKAKIPCKCRLHKYSCLMKLNKNEQCTSCGDCICKDCLRWFSEAKQLSKKSKALAARIDKTSKSNEKRKN